MRAKYYRFLFQNAGDGICYTGSVTDSNVNESCNFIYISGREVPLVESGNPDQRFQDAVNYDFMFLADICYFSVHQAVHQLKCAKVSKVIMPEYDLEELRAYADKTDLYDAQEREFLADPYQYMENAGVGEVCKINVEESFVFCGWQFHVAVFGKGIHKSLALYHSPANIDKKLDDTIMAVKYFSNQEPCRVCVSLDTASCGMKCGLYNDFEICKKHNGTGGQDYIDGSLLLGSTNLADDFEAVHHCFKDVWNKIRFVVMANGENDEEWNKKIINVGPERYKQYFVIPRGDGSCINTIRDISMASPYKQLIMTSEDYGLCCSGFYKHRENE